MKTKAIFGVVAGLLLIAGFMFVTASDNTDQEIESPSEKETVSFCENSCNLDNNCGKASCGIVENKKCGCNR